MNIIKHCLFTMCSMPNIVLLPVVQSVGIVQSGSNKTVLSVSAYMRHYALDKEGFIAVGSKDFVAKEMHLSFVKRQNSGCWWMLAHLPKQRMVVSLGIFSF